MKGLSLSRFADKKWKLQFGPLPWLTGLREPGLYPESTLEPLLGGGDAEKIKQSTARGML